MSRTKAGVKRPKDAYFAEAPINLESKVLDADYRARTMQWLLRRALESGDWKEARLIIDTVERWQRGESDGTIVTKWIRAMIEQEEGEH